MNAKIEKEINGVKIKVVVIKEIQQRIGFAGGKRVEIGKEVHETRYIDLYNEVGQSAHISDLNELYVVSMPTTPGFRVSSDLAFVSPEVYAVANAAVTEAYEALDGPDAAEIAEIEKAA